MSSKSVTWQYGITTVRNRIDTTLPGTIASLAAGGFDKPHLFVDGCKDPAPYYERFNVSGVTCHYPNIKCYGNFMTGLWYLLMSNCHADYYAMFQDDFITSKGLREYLEKTPYIKNTYRNLYTFPNNQRKCPPGS